MKKADIGVAIYILSAFIMLIVPIPSQLLDVLLACNIAVAFSVMFGCMFAKEVLDLSFFPTVLLFTTVFDFFERFFNTSDSYDRRSGKCCGYLW